MPALSRVDRTARKEHICDFCGCKIEPGERYEIETGFFDCRPYTWKSHIHCRDLCAKLWDYADPDEPGMTSSDFMDAAQNAMSVFYCPYHCPKYKVEEHGCDDAFNEGTCLPEFAKFMKDKHLFLTQSENGILCWTLRTEANHD